MNNLDSLKTFISKGGNIPDLIKKSISSNNPVMGNLIDMANKGDTKGTVGYISSLYPDNVLLITMLGHITCSKYGNIYDTFDCTEREAEYVWIVK